MRFLFVVAAGVAMGELVALLAERNGMDPVRANLMFMPFAYVLFMQVSRWHKRKP